MSDKLTLYFEGSSRLELVRSEFKAEDSQKTLASIRGKTSGAFTQCGSFQWTSAVRAVCAVAIRFALSELNEKVDYCLMGGKGTLAASLDYAISKGPSWIAEMFGSASAGTPYAKRLFRITNPNRKRPGPVAVALNRQRLTGESLAIYWDGRKVETQEQLYSMLIAIEEQGLPREIATAKPANDTPEEALDDTANS
jgi:hypothetical protein